MNKKTAPLLMPRAPAGAHSLDPLQPEPYLWTTFHTTRIQLPTGESLPLLFSSDDLAALQPWLPPA